MCVCVRATSEPSSTGRYWLGAVRALGQISSQLQSATSALAERDIMAVVVVVVLVVVMHMLPLPPVGVLDRMYINYLTLLSS